ncbi:hypothetical protein JV46_12610 [Solemya velum gill symbiont]|uniref:Uncharacterized protein n=1 Tax=Solemya velum gill symbiont TaxID=2340 RepID=A0A0B0HAD5_SOVGS|nr:hypothetical protein JV46_12610 [Solemya velum gill symbiont]
MTMPMLMFYHMVTTVMTALFMTMSISVVTVPWTVAMFVDMLSVTMAMLVRMPGDAIPVSTNNNHATIFTVVLVVTILFVSNCRCDNQ